MGGGWDVIYHRKRDSRVLKNRAQIHKHLRESEVMIPFLILAFLALITHCDIVFSHFIPIWVMNRPFYQQLTLKRCCEQNAAKKSIHGVESYCE